MQPQFPTMSPETLSKPWTVQAHLMSRGVAAMRDSVEAVMTAQANSLSQVETLLSASTDPESLSAAATRTAQGQVEVTQSLATRLSKIGQDAATEMMSDLAAAETPKAASKAAKKTTKA